MKKIIFLSIAFMCLSASAFAWGRLGHATVAYIAEQHLTPKARKALNEYLHGQSLAGVSSLNDDLKSEMLVDYGVDFKDAPRVAVHPHTFEAAAGTFEPTRVFDDNGRYVKNCLYFIDEYSKNLRANAKEMDDSTRFAQIISIVHLMGDMHCPEHIRYLGEDMTIGYYNVMLGKEAIRYHTLWDDRILTVKRPWSFSDLAYLIDRITPAQAKAITAGDVWAWGKDSAECSYPVHSVKEGEKLENNYLLNHLPLAENQILKAGYRLAAILNATFR